MGFSLIVSSATYTLFGRSRSYSLVMFDLSWISIGVVLRAVTEYCIPESVLEKQVYAEGTEV